MVPSLVNILKNCVKSRRFLITLMGFLGFLIDFSNRGSLSIAIVAMTKEVNVTLGNGTVVKEKEFNWNSREQGLILSSFFYAGIFTHIIAGPLAKRYGGHIIFGIGIGFCSLLMLVIPLAAKLGIYYLVAVRILMGLLEGISTPCIYDIIYHWAPVCEKTTIVGIIMTGCPAGVFFTFFISGLLAVYIGWESIFYFIGGLGCIWYIFWVIYIKRDPASDPRITPEERAYIEENFEDVIEHSEIPWKKILTSRPVYAILVVNFCFFWSVSLLTTEVPTYLNDVLHYRLESTGILAALPFLVQIFMTFVTGPICDRVRSKGILTTEQVRKLGISYGFLVPGLILGIMANLTSPTAISICLIFAVGSAALCHVNYTTNVLDFAPNYSSVIMGIASSLGVVTGIIAPLLSGYIVQNGTHDEWKIVFYISIGFCILGSMTFILIGETEVQEWAVSPKKQETSANLSEGCNEIRMNEHE